MKHMYMNFFEMVILINLNAHVSLVICNSYLFTYFAHFELLITFILIWKSYLYIKLILLFSILMWNVLSFHIKIVLFVFITDKCVQYFSWWLVPLLLYLRKTFLYTEIIHTILPFWVPTNSTFLHDNFGKWWMH